MVDAGKQASFRYNFIPGELSGGRSFGLLINVNYKDTVSVKACRLLKKWTKLRNLEPCLFTFAKCLIRSAKIFLQEDNMYRDGVYNQTIQVRENEDGVDTETWGSFLSRALNTTDSF